MSILNSVPFRSTLGPVLVAAGLMGAPAAAQEACQIYTVQRGDTLSNIAKTANVDGGYQLLYSANRDVIENVNIIEVGLRLRIPCADGSLPLDGAAAQPAVVATAEPQPAATAPADGPLPPIRFLTGGNYAPFTGEDLPQQGLFTELLTTAVREGKPDQEFRIIFINDWGAHLTDLLPTGAFDMGFPWYLPDCTKVDRLSPANAIRCTEFDASDPFFEAVVGFYTLLGSPYTNASGPEQLYGARLCRPDGWFTFDLEADGLVEPNITMVIDPTQVGCWEQLQAGTVDVVTFDALPAEADIKALGLTDKVVEVPAAANVARLHVLTPKTNPNGRAYLDIMNRGLAKMRTNGEWFAIVSRHLASQ